MTELAVLLSGIGIIVGAAMFLYGFIGFGHRR